MAEYIGLYAEYGAMGVVVALFIWNFVGMSKRADNQDRLLDGLEKENAVQTTKINNLESILLKLLDRWNTSDATRDRRHEDMVKEMNSLSDMLNRMDGIMSRMNGKP